MHAKSALSPQKMIKNREISEKYPVGGVHKTADFRKTPPPQTNQKIHLLKEPQGNPPNPQNQKVGDLLRAAGSLAARGPPGGLRPKMKSGKSQTELV